MATDTRFALGSRPDLGDLTIRSFRDGGTHVVALAGELDLDTATELMRELAAVELAQPPEVAVDLRELTFIDSIGVRLLFNAHQRAEAGGYRLIVVRGPAAIERICGFCELMNPLSLGDRLAFVDALPSEAATTEAAPTVDACTPVAASAPQAAHRAASRRRVQQATLAVSVRELRTTHRRRSAVSEKAPA